LSNQSELWIVAPEEARFRLDQFILNRIQGESRSQLQNWIRREYVQVNGAPAKTGYRVKAGDRIALNVPAAEPDQPFAEDIPLEIIYEDADLAVINKPAGLVCHVGAGVRSGTLVNALLFRLGKLETGDPGRPGIVHRLDKHTSGVMLVAKNSSAHRGLAQQFKNREVKKEYLAMVYGIPSPPAGTIDVAIGRDPNDRKKISVRARHKRNAISHYTIKDNYLVMALLSVKIETGRTHQIRVHLAHKGHPVVGDSVYGPGRTRNLPPKVAQAVGRLNRPFLHSHRLEFLHPRTGEPLAFESPLPSELRQFIAEIG
jgi:23S rRNA pseudouridine1911/1915/1917 synthase